MASFYITCMQFPEEIRPSVIVPARELVKRANARRAGNASLVGEAYLKSKEKADRDREMAVRLAPAAGLIVSALSHALQPDPMVEVRCQVGSVGVRVRKLRTMEEGAVNEVDFTDGRAMSDLKGGLGMMGDPRVRHFLARFLRLCHLDELPQIEQAANDELLVVAPRWLSPTDMETVVEYSDQIPAFRGYLLYLLNGGRLGSIFLPEVCGQDGLNLQERVYMNDLGIKNASRELDQEILRKLLWSAFTRVKPKQSSLARQRR